jgi:hypothetical protein
VLAAACSYSTMSGVKGRKVGEMALFSRQMPHIVQ